MNVIKLSGIRIHAPLTRLQTGTTVSFSVLSQLSKQRNIYRLRQMIICTACEAPEFILTSNGRFSYSKQWPP